VIGDPARWIGGALLLAAAGGLAWWLAEKSPAPIAPKPVPPALARLARGVNLSNWLQHGPATEASRYAPDAADWQRIRALGLTHVRVPVDPSALVDERGLPDPARLAALRAALEAAVAEDLLVVLTVQLPAQAKAGLAERAEDRAALAGTWRWLAQALRDLPPTHLAFEPLNEPELADAETSRVLLAGLAAELRAIAPAHTLVVSGHRYSGVDELLALRPLDDPNVVYGFHFYEPHNFTHQGANWGDAAWLMLRHLPYPSSPEAAAERMSSVPPAAHDLLRWHGEERWNAARIRTRIALAAQWARTHGVPVWCSEFGAMKPHAVAADRAAWLGDVRAALDEHGIPWAHWDYAGPFGLVAGEQGRREPDVTAIEALGLRSE
jgi:endoglucanase